MKLILLFFNYLNKAVQIKQVLCNEHHNTSSFTNPSKPYH